MDKEKWKALYQQQSAENVEANSEYKLWYQYYKEIEEADRIVCPNGIPRTRQEMVIINKNAMGVKNRLQLCVSRKNRHIRMAALRAVEDYYSVHNNNTHE